MKIVLLSVVLAIIAGFGGGWTYQAILGSKTAPSGSSSKAGSSAASDSSSTAKTQTLAECLTEVWGADKYAAISANSSLATTDDNLASLKCYD